MGLRSWWTDQSSGVKALAIVGIAVTALFVLIAVTVILAAVIGAFVIGIGEEEGASAPQVTIDCQIDDDGLTIVHTDGDALDPDEIEVDSDGGDAQLPDGLIS